MVQAALEWLDTPFMPQQSRKGSGCDCAGLVVGVARELGLVATDFSLPAYRQRPDGSMAILCDQYLARVDRTKALPGDVVMMRFDREPQHLGILIPYREGILGIIHALTRSGKVVQHRLDARWRSFVIAAYSFPGIED